MLVADAKAHTGGETPHGAGTVELDGIDKGFDHQHRMPVTNLPITREPIQG